MASSRTAEAGDGLSPPQNTALHLLALW